MSICNICKTEKNIKHFDKKGIEHDSRCKKCKGLERKKRYGENREIELKQCKKYRQENAEKIRAKQRAKYQREKEKVSKLGRVYREKNKEKIALRNKKRNPMLKEKYKANPRIRLNTSMRCGIYYSIKNNKNGRAWVSLVDYNLNDLIQHLSILMERFNKENPDKEKMTLDNYGTIWHIDHKTPISAFNFEEPEHDDFKRCWNLSNLQPLWAVDNFIKNNKISKPFQPQLMLR